MKRLIEQFVDNGKDLSVKDYLFVFLKFVQVREDAFEKIKILLRISQPFIKKMKLVIYFAFFFSRKHKRFILIFSGSYTDCWIRLHSRDTIMIGKAKKDNLSSFYQFFQIWSLRCKILYMFSE